MIAGTNSHRCRFGKQTYHFSEDDDINNIVDFFLTQDRRIFSTKSFLGRDSCTMELHLQMGQSVLDDPHPRCLLPSIFSLPLYSLSQVFYLLFLYWFLISCMLLMMVNLSSLFVSYLSLSFRFLLPLSIHLNIIPLPTPLIHFRSSHIEMVESGQFCEDILMNFVVSHVTRLPPIKVAQRKSLKDASASYSYSSSSSSLTSSHSSSAALSASSHVSLSQSPYNESGFSVKQVWCRRKPI